MLKHSTEPDFGVDDAALRELELMKLLATLRHSDERYRIAAENSSEIILDYNLLDSSIYHVTSRVTEIYGIPQFITHAPEDLIYSGAIAPESAQDFENVFQQLKDGAPKCRCTLKTRTLQGETRWAEVILTGIYSDSGRPCRAIGVLKDITTQHIAELQYEKELQHRDAMVKEALLYYEADLTNHKILSGIQPVLKSAGLPYTENYEDCQHIIFEQMVHPDDWVLLGEAYAVDNLLSQYAAGQRKVETEYRRLTADGESYWVRGTAYMAEDAESHSVRAYYYVHDIHKAKLRELQFQQEAELDLLTGLYNKVTAERLTRAAISIDTASAQMAAYLIIDLDNFKEVNDNLGHAYGDALLSQIAQRLQHLCSSGDIVGRIGGDEFALYLRYLSDPSRAEQIATDICNSFHHNAAALHGQQVTCTIGLALLPEDGLDFDVLYRRADLALYEAKRTGKDGWQRYHTNLDDSSRVPLLRETIVQGSDKTFAGNIMEYVFRILYESQALRQGIVSVLELVSGHFHFVRGYLFEPSGDNLCLGQCEWFSAAAAPLPGALRVANPTDIPPAQFYLSGDALLATLTSEGLRGIICPQPIVRTSAQCIQLPLGSSSLQQGFLGFDLGRHPPQLSVAEANTLLCVAQMMGLFLSRECTAEQSAT